MEREQLRQSEGARAEMHSRDRRWPVVFVPGGVMPAALSYGPTIEAIKNDAQPILKDLEVYAGDTPPANYSLDLEVEGIRHAADEAGLRSFHLVGYSGGGAASLAFTAKYPEKVRSLALIEPAWIGNEGWTPEEVAYWQEIDHVMALPPAERMPAFVRVNSRPGSVSTPPSGSPPPWMAKRPEGLAAMTRAFPEHALNWEHLRHFEKPVYLAVGGLSHPVEKIKAERLARLFPNIRMEVYAERDHFDPPQRAEAERLARALRELWAQGEELIPAGQ